MEILIEEMYSLDLGQLQTGFIQKELVQCETNIDILKFSIRLF